MAAWIVILTVIIGTAQLCLGFRVGIRIGRLQQQRRRLIRQHKDESRPAATRRAAKWKECAEGVDDLNERAQNLAADSANYEPPLTEEFLEAIVQLAEATAALQRQMHGAGKLFNPEPPAKENGGDLASAAAGGPARRPGKGSTTGLTAAELLELAKQPGDHGGQSIQQQRFPYSALQYMAPCTEHDLPSSAGFQPVMCNDLSVNGISFLLDAAPEFEFVVISVGVPAAPIFVLGRARFFRKVSVHDTERWLVGCEFIKRLPAGQFDWEQLSSQHGAAVGA
ncbi:MAG TPA: hypothetical protein VHV55_28590 [Pirellulales bacterium]|jgi:hypothetical protein|nr:hypothetical protein [Pirellulales bacterium]